MGQWIAYLIWRTSDTHHSTFHLWKSHLQIRCIDVITWHQFQKWLPTDMPFHRMRRWKGEGPDILNKWIFFIGIIFTAEQGSINPFCCAWYMPLERWSKCNDPNSAQLSQSCSERIYFPRGFGIEEEDYEYCRSMCGQGKCLLNNVWTCILNVDRSWVIAYKWVGCVFFGYTNIFKY